jgi:acyl-coenzyme A thioesterase PaaI-like protein
MTGELNPPSLAEAINAKGFTGAAGVRIVAVTPGQAKIALSRRDDLLQFFGHFHGGIITALADQATGIGHRVRSEKGQTRKSSRLPRTVGAVTEYFHSQDFHAAIGKFRQPSEPRLDMGRAIVGFKISQR